MPFAIDGKLQLGALHPRHKRGAAFRQGRALIEFQHELRQVIVDGQDAPQNDVFAARRVDGNGVAVVSQAAQGFADIPRIAHMVRLGAGGHRFGHVSQTGRALAQGIGDGIVHDSVSLLF
ncbi:hypothetical protein [Janthinobacterium lividum]|uniref:hypothetical protein n=1 Tax=Janthinobacterium lividum TaxID=29581 RepID=UPI002092C2D3|nr:hypothetical protein [Janthinobacterium lividum]